jgi:hypothetical protein
VSSRKREALLGIQSPPPEMIGQVDWSPDNTSGVFQGRRAH